MSFKCREEEEKRRSCASAVWSYLHAAMSLGKRQHETWTKGGSGRVNKKHTRTENILNLIEKTTGNKL